MTTKKNFVDSIGKAARMPKPSKKDMANGKRSRPSKTVSATLKQKHASH
ncbi:MAG: hypothetical protein JWO00_452 [Candidatus Parcubacteria bacterium]|nr:hypothetical protein [Candidatus Parcubacteria bacterium]